MGGEELLAVALALGYVIFAIRQQRIAWVLAAVSAGLYLHIFAAVELYMAQKFSFGKAQLWHSFWRQ